jgi:hypothetical protein
VNAFYTTFAALVEQPWLALVPAVLLLALAYVRRSRFAGAVGIVWVVYSLYELGMRARLLCSGECNIRIDLLVIYPVLAVLSLAAIVALFRGRKDPSA